MSLLNFSCRSRSLNSAVSHWCPDCNQWKSIMKNKENDIIHQMARAVRFFKVSNCLPNAQLFHAKAKQNEEMIKL